MMTEIPNSPNQTGDLTAESNIQESAEQTPVYLDEIKAGIIFIRAALQNYQNGSSEFLGSIDRKKYAAWLKYLNDVMDNGQLVDLSIKGRELIELLVSNIGLIQHLAVESDKTVHLGDAGVDQSTMAQATLHLKISDLIDQLMGILRFNSLEEFKDAMKLESPQKT